MLSPLVLALSLATGEIPADVQSCIRAQKMWVAAPDFFEVMRIDGKRAYQILDHSGELTGHLLVLPETCRIMVLIRTADGSSTLTFPDGTRPTARELGVLLRWAKLRSFYDDRNTFYWLHDGTLEAIALSSEERRSLALECPARLSNAGLELQCQPSKLIAWAGLREWMHWPEAQPPPPHDDP